MIGFKFLSTTKRPILDSILTEHELIDISEYCSDVCNGEYSGDVYYPQITFIDKRVVNGSVTRINLDFYKNEKIISFGINVTIRGILYVFTVSSVHITSTHHDMIRYELHEEL